MLRKLPLLMAVIVALAVLPARAAAYLPPGFIGVSPQSQANAKDFELMRKAAVRSVRLPLNWGAVEEGDPAFFLPEWGAFDREVELAAQAGIRVMPFVWSTPEWVAPDATDLPVRSAWQRGAWTTFLHEAVERYGPEGEFWEENPALPFLPIHRWEIWNEENIVSFAEHPDPVAFAKLVRISGRAIHAADPEAQVILGGLFGRPLQIPPNVASGNFLARVYRAGNVRRYFDAVALHPYVADATAMVWQLRNLRRIMALHHDAAKPIYLTELGWGSSAGPTRWERGIYGQADQLTKAFSIVSANRVRWRIGGVWWFTWTDEGGTCQFCRSAGLLNAAREGKPSWYRFNEWTGGNPDTVPRLKLHQPGEELEVAEEAGVAGE
jgi:polysaccharide biosynthesis protein PslG